jgi:hypothetical protein
MNNLDIAHQYFRTLLLPAKIDRPGFCLNQSYLRTADLTAQSDQDQIAGKGK